MESDLLNEALEKFPDAVSNYEALTSLAMETNKQLSRMKDKLSNHFIALRNKYFEIRNLRDSLPVIKTKSA